MTMMLRRRRRNGEEDVNSHLNINWKLSRVECGAAKSDCSERFAFCISSSANLIAQKGYYCEE